MDSSYRLICMNGFVLRAEGANLIIETRRDEECIPISKIQSFTMKEPGFLSPGQIVFKTAQAATVGVNIGFGISAALGAERTFSFSSDNLYSAKKLQQYITSYEARTQAPSTSVGAVSVADEIRGLKSLMEDGIISKEEFEAKKRQLLGI